MKACLLHQTHIVGHMKLEITEAESKQDKEFWALDHPIALCAGRFDPFSMTCRCKMALSRPRLA